MIQLPKFKCIPEIANQNLICYKCGSTERVYYECQQSHDKFIAGETYCFICSLP